MKLSVLVATSDGPQDRTRAALDALIAGGFPIEYIVVRGGDGDLWNRALAVISARLVAFLDDGLVPDPEWYAGVMRALERNPNVDAIASNVIAAGSGEAMLRPAGVSFTGHLLPAATAPTEITRTAVLGRSWVAQRSRIARAGGFDTFTSMPYGLVDLAWRFWLTGQGVVFDPDFVTGDGAESGAVNETRAALTMERDALVTIFRNLDERNLSVAMPAARKLSRARLDADPTATNSDVQDVMDAFERARAGLQDQRRCRQAARKRPDAEVVGAFGPTLEPDTLTPGFVEAHRGVIDGLGDDHVFAGRHRVVVITADTLGVRMAGPGIRAVRVAEHLAREHDVKLASTTSADVDGFDFDFDISVADPKGIAELVEWCDIAVFQGWVFAGNPSFKRPDRIFLVDIYDPMHLEQLEQARDLGSIGRLDSVRRATAVLNEQLIRGDSFFCASGKQRDFWLGQMAALGRINPLVYDDDPSLETLITNVPFGISNQPPVRTRAALKGVVPGIGNDDRVILWGGGVYNWFDPLTLLRAVDRLRVRCDDIRLVFLGMRHPNPDIPEMRMAVETRKLAEQLGLIGTHVFFNEEWVAYEDRQNFLLDADLAVTTHLHHIETEFSFRTRVLDYFWAGLPTVATAGDALADLIDQRCLGLTVPPGDVEALTEALFRILDDRDFNMRCRANVEAIRSSFLWSNVLEPIAARCSDPRRAPDLIAGVVHTDPAVDLGGQLLEVGLARDVRVAYRHLREQGPMVVVEKVQNRIRRRLR